MSSPNCGQVWPDSEHEGLADLLTKPPIQQPYLKNRRGSFEIDRGNVIEDLDRWGQALALIKFIPVEVIGHPFDDTIEYRGYSKFFQALGPNDAPVNYTLLVAYNDDDRSIVGGVKIVSNTCDYEMEVTLDG